MKLFKSITLSFLLLGATAIAQAQSTPVCCNEARQFVATGSAEIKVQPDRVTLSVGITDRSSDLAKARENMDGTIKAILSYAARNGVNKENIQTSYLDIRPETRYDDQGRVIASTNYVLTQTLTITLDKVELYNKFTYDLLGLGVNVVSDIQFTSSNEAKLQDQARTQAVAAAKERAQLLANAAGIKLGRVLNVTEENNYNPMYRRSAAVANDSMDGGADSAAAGMISIKATVNLTYELVD